MDSYAEPAIQTRNSIEDIWGPRTPYKDEWPTRVDKTCDVDPEKWVQSACVLCSNGCGLDIGVKDDKVVGVWKAMHREDRLKYPMIRKNGRLERASWDEAIDLILAKSKELQKHLTNHSIAFYTTGQFFLEYYALALVGKAGLHTLHMDGNTRLCTATAAASMRKSFGSDATQTILWSRILDRLAGSDPPRLIVVDPRLSESARKATLHLAPRAGTSLALLSGIQHLLFKNDWIHHEYVSQHTVGLEELKAVVEEYDPQTVQDITGVSRSEYPGSRNHQNPEHMAELAWLWNIDLVQFPHWSQPTHVMNLLSYIKQGTVRMLWISGTNPLVSLPNLPRVRRLLTQPGLLVVCQDIYPTETTAIADVVLPAAQWSEKTGCFTNVDRTVHISHRAVDPPGECRPDLDIFLDYGRRMGFRDKDDNDLLPYAGPEEVFEAWKKLSAGRPCDYTGISYARMTGGSGIQLPCNAANPHGTERLYADGRFFTDVAECESYGHDMETSAPYTKVEYQRLNPAGRAILKACDYKPPAEAPDQEFPLRLMTGRNVYQFHTRTKMGRTALQKRCRELEVRVSEEDAVAVGVADREVVIVRSRRGAVEMKCRVGRVAEGQVFMPFQFGYWDATDGRARAANELTPLFKSGAVRVEKIPDSRGGSGASVEDAATIHSTEDLTRCERQMELWLDEAYETTVQLLIHDQEMECGVQVLHTIAESMRARLEPQVQKLGENKQRGHHHAHILREALFPPEHAPGSPYEVLEMLQGLVVYLSHIRASLTALRPVALAM
ncbi:hypothetical protein B0T18DRAFT_387442 [Schizothecium vesticola]|uniref:4Fe-4S Mo/W bis-MGD-type domain-containing protein n=1 Tax=Schizothecium vesticola TaxID=314040 RepID=A0AA40F5N2_9PEZI|nr:hypothetical protein B0T18DRAFT_387442 [Schizothecium vesticola]